ncbi:hypothetical protein ACIG56_17320 [Nocardia fusca]|uniref:hypothetical protein n=1 Tax=Nocardia fusca TaxID=941183 RepID=UPI0037C90B39
MAEQDQLKHWQGLKQQAVSGEMTMEDGVGTALALECETLLDNLRQRKQDAEALQFLSGYGGLPSALDMKAKFEKVAVGEDGAVSRLGDLIEIVTLMRDTYAAAVGKLRDTDRGTSQALRGVVF